MLVSIRFVTRFCYFVTSHLGKISAQLHTIVKQICVPSGNVFFCHCFLSPRTECIMLYGAVRKFYSHLIHQQLKSINSTATARYSINLRSEATGVCLT